MEVPSIKAGTQHEKIDRGRDHTEALIITVTPPGSTKYIGRGAIKAEVMILGVDATQKFQPVHISRNVLRLI